MIIYTNQNSQIVAAMYVEDPTSSLNICAYLNIQKLNKVVDTRYFKTFESKSEQSTIIINHTVMIHKELPDFKKL